MLEKSNVQNIILLKRKKNQTVKFHKNIVFFTLNMHNILRINISIQRKLVQT